MSPETAKRLEIMRHQILLDARRKKKPTDEGEDVPNYKRQAIYMQYIKTIDLQRNLFGDRVNNVSFNLVPTLLYI